MLFSKPLFSFVVAFTAASGVIASTVPVPRDDYPAPSPAPTNVCNGGTTTCCNTWTNSQNPALGGPVALLQSVLDGNLVNGLNCASVLSGGNCNTQQLCCQNVEQESLVGLNCVPITVL